MAFVDVVFKGVMIRNDENDTLAPNLNKSKKQKEIFTPNLSGFVCEPGE